jgi:predicted transcriptional regulator
MTKQASSLRSYFAKLGLAPEATEIYLALHAEGPQTISELARNSGVARIQIYRLLDSLKAYGVIEVETRYKRSIIHAGSISNIAVIITKKEQELKELQRDYVTISQEFADKSIRSTTTRVKFYEGMEGLKQMLWNQTKGKSENLAILYDSMQNKTSLTFFERWIYQCNEQNLHFRGIIGDHFIKMQQAWYITHNNERLRHWESRYVSEDAFPITHSLITYDDVVLHFDWNNDRAFGIEIYNPGIARVQRQFFEMLWQQATPVDDLVGLNVS